MANWLLAISNVIIIASLLPLAGLKHCSAVKIISTMLESLGLIASI
jgi:hypothetical protein